MSVAASAAITLLQVVWVHWQFGGERATQYLSDLITLPITGAACAICWAVARRENGPTRRGWFLLGGAMLSWGLGEAVWSLYELGLGRDVPFPSLADVGYLAMIPLAGAALVSFAAHRRITAQMRTLVDGLIIGCSLLFVSWVVVLGAAFRGGSGSVLEQTIALAYPVGDVVIITFVLYLAARTHGDRRVPVLMIGSGLVCIAFADSAFTYLVQNDAYASGNPIDAAWTAGFLLIGLAALRARATGVAPAMEEERAERRGALLPYGAVLVAAAVAAVEQVRTGSLGPFLFWNALVVVLLVLARVYVTVTENAALARGLEAKVLERTAELEAAVQKLAEARRLQDAFVASVSHELRTPITTMLGTTTTMLRPELGLSDDVRLLAEGARRGADQMSRLVEDLLVASAITDGIQCARSPFDVADELRLALLGFGSVLGERLVPGVATAGERVVEGIPSSLVAVGDAGRFRVVMHHLLANAVKFTERETRIFVDAIRTDEHVEVVVRDEGLGIPPEQWEKVFERFYQVDGSLTRRQGGAGLGLFIARRLTEGMGGRLEIAETVGPGTTFKITLPAPAIRRLEPEAPRERITAGTE